MTADLKRFCKQNLNEADPLLSDFACEIVSDPLKSIEFKQQPYTHK